MVLELGHNRAGEDAWQVGAAPAAVNNEASSGTQAQTFRSPGQSRYTCCLAGGQPFVPRGCSGRSGRAPRPAVAFARRQYSWAQIGGAYQQTLPPNRRPCPSFLDKIRFPPWRRSTHLMTRTTTSLVATSCPTRSRNMAALRAWWAQHLRNSVII
eukprot:COSAG06_NODE_3744_length_4941_cov_3.304679_4_plen_155_part_00